MNCTISLGFYQVNMSFVGNFIGITSSCCPSLGEEKKKTTNLTGDQLFWKWVTLKYHDLICEFYSIDPSTNTMIDKNRSDLMNMSEDELIERMKK